MRRIKNPQKIRACIQPDLGSCMSLFCAKAMLRVVKIRFMGWSIRFSFSAFSRRFNFGHALRAKAVSVLRIRKTRTQGCRLGGTHSKARLIYWSISGVTPSCPGGVLASPPHLPIRGTNTEEECHGHRRLRRLVLQRMLLHIVPLLPRGMKTNEEISQAHEG